MVLVLQSLVRAGKLLNLPLQLLHLLIDALEESVRLSPRVLKRLLTDLALLVAQAAGKLRVLLLCALLSLLCGEALIPVALEPVPEDRVVDALPGEERVNHLGAAVLDYGPYHRILNYAV